MVGTLVSQQEGPGSGSNLSWISVWSLHVLLVLCMCGFSPSFLPQSRNRLHRLSDDSKLSPGVNVRQTGNMSRAYPAFA